MENNTYKTTLKVIGTINSEMLYRFMNDTDEIIEAYNQYKEETSYVKDDYVGEFDRITIEISSYGGCTDSGSAMLDRIMEMQDMGIHVDTHCNGFAYSMAFILFIVGERRTGGKFSKYMNHGSSAGACGMIEKMKTDISFYEECDEQFDNLILLQTKMPKERLEMAKLKNDWIFYDEAIELGIVNVYKGMKETEEEKAERISKAFDLSIKTFTKLSKLDEGEAFFTMYDIMVDILNEVMEEGKKLENKKTEKQLAEETLAEIELCKSEGYKCEECGSYEECKRDMERAKEILGIIDEEEDNDNEDETDEE